MPAGWGGTSECVIEYDYSNLDLDKHEEWTKHKVPHLCGYIEEMAHNFVSATGAQFGWEMVGWSLGMNVCRKVADNPVFQRDVAETRKTQSQTFARFRALNCTFPPDLEPNETCYLPAISAALVERLLGAFLKLSPGLEPKRLVLPSER